LPVNAAHDAVAVHVYMHVAEFRRRLYEWREGAFGTRASTGSGFTPDDWENDTPAAVHGLGQQQVVSGVVEVFLAKQDVHADSAWRLCRNPMDQFCM